MSRAAAPRRTRVRLTPRRTRVRLTPRRRHLAAIITIALSTAFVAVMVLAGNLMSLSLTSGVADSYRGADLVATTDDYTAKAPSIPGADHVWPQIMSGAEFTGSGSRTAFAQIVLDPPASAEAPSLVSGHAPRGDHEVLIDQSAADALHVTAGGTISLPAERSPSGSAVELTVAGITQPSAGAALLGGSATVHLTEASMPTVLGSDGAQTNTFLITVPAGTDPQTVATAATSDTVTIQTAQDAIDDATAQMLQGMASLSIVFGVFVVIALITSAVVIANTFAVTIAQRVRSLALLRTLGARRSQVAGIVLRESFAVGLIGSLLGVLGGHLLVQAALLAAAAIGWIDGTVIVPISLWSVAAPILAGLIVTLLAGLGPVRAATSVAPLQALRPQQVTGGRGILVRGVIGAILAVLGLGVLALGVLATQHDSPGVGVLAALAGGAMSFLGVLVGLIAVTGPLARLGGAVIGRIGGLPARMAGSTTQRNPRRSAATIAALVIGTTLMTMMAVGASTANASLTGELDNKRPVDVVISAAAMPNDAATQVQKVRGIDHAEKLMRGDVKVSTGEPMTIFGATPAQIDAVSHRSDLGPQLTDGTIVLGSDRAEKFGVHDGQTLSVTGADGTKQSVRIHVDGTLKLSLTTPATLQRLTGTTTPVVMATFADPDSAARADVSAEDISSGVQTAITKPGWTDARADIGGNEREMYATILNVLLGITVALLAVAVLVALVGVANTLSLGVIERTGENALLRALGTTRRQMRAILGWEGVLLALLGAIIGIVLGVLYGVLGIASILGGAAPILVSIPWGQIALVLVLAVLAGLAASVLPGRRAARTAPAAALAAAEQ